MYYFLDDCKCMDKSFSNVLFGHIIKENKFIIESQKEIDE